MAKEFSRRNLFRLRLGDLSDLARDTLSQKSEGNTPMEETAYIRPPGAARDDSLFLQKCDRCKLCSEACPYGVIRHSGVVDGDLEGAAEAFMVLPILYAHEQWVRKGLLAGGECFEQLRQPAKARGLYEELLDRFPDSEESRVAKARMRGL